MEKLLIRVNLKLTNYPDAVDHLSTEVLLKNSLLREYGQLLQIKLVRVLNVKEPSTFIYHKTK